MTETTLTRRGAATRQRLLDAAEQELVARDGMLEVASVAQRAGVSVGLLYRYFGSKGGLVAAVVDDFYERLAAATLPARAAGPTWAERERARTELTVEFHYRDPLARVILSRLSRDPQVAGLEVDRVANLVADATRSVQRGQHRGEIPADIDAGTVGAMLIGGFRVALAEALSRRHRPDQAKLTEELWRFVQHGARAA